MLTEEIEEPIVILDHDGLLIWDGYHRCAASVIKGIPPKVVWGVDKSLVLDRDLAAPPISVPGVRL